MSKQRIMQELDKQNKALLARIDELEKSNDFLGGNEADRDAVLGRMAQDRDDAIQDRDAANRKLELEREISRNRDDTEAQLRKECETSNTIMHNHTKLYEDEVARRREVTKRLRDCNELHDKVYAQRENLIAQVKEIRESRAKCRKELAERRKHSRELEEEHNKATDALYRLARFMDQEVGQSIRDSVDLAMNEVIRLRDIIGTLSNQPGYFSYGNQRYQEGYDEAEKERGEEFEALQGQVDKIGTMFHTFATTKKTLFVSDDVRDELIDRGDKIKGLEAYAESLESKVNEAVPPEQVATAGRVARKVLAELEECHVECKTLNADLMDRLCENADLVIERNRLNGVCDKLQDEIDRVGVERDGVRGQRDMFRDMHNALEKVNVEMMKGGMQQVSLDDKHELELLRTQNREYEGATMRMVEEKGDMMERLELLREDRRKATVARDRVVGERDDCRRALAEYRKDREELEAARNEIERLRRCVLGGRT